MCWQENSRRLRERLPCRRQRKDLRGGRQHPDTFQYICHQVLGRVLRPWPISTCSTRSICMSSPPKSGDRVSAVEVLLGGHRTVARSRPRHDQSTCFGVHGCKVVHWIAPHCRTQSRLLWLACEHLLPQVPNLLFAMRMFCAVVRFTHWHQVEVALATQMCTTKPSSTRPAKLGHSLIDRA